MPPLTQTKEIAKLRQANALDQARNLQKIGQLSAGQPEVRIKGGVITRSPRQWDTTTHTPVRDPRYVKQSRQVTGDQIVIADFKKSDTAAEVLYRCDGRGIITDVNDIGITVEFFHKESSEHRFFLWEQVGGKNLKLKPGRRVVSHSTVCIVPKSSEAESKWRQSKAEREAQQFTREVIRVSQARPESGRIPIQRVGRR